MRDEQTPKDVSGEATQTLYGSSLGFEFYRGMYKNKQNTI